VNTVAKIEETLPKRYHQIPSDLFLGTKNPSWGARGLLAFFYSLDFPDKKGETKGGCYPSTDLIVKLTGLSESSITRYKQELVACGWIMVVPGNRMKGETDTIIFVKKPAPARKSPVKKQVNQPAN
jgi:hypothetical protein